MEITQQRFRSDGDMPPDDFDKIVFPVAETVAVIPAYPNGMVSIQLIEWLHFIGIPRERIRTYSHEGRDIVCSYNAGIKHVALKSSGKYFIFADNDVRPNPKQTQRFLELEADIVACEYEGECVTAEQWMAENSFHCALWRTSRAVLESMQRPWFSRQYLDDGCKERGCACNSFGESALRQGFTIRHGGYVGHSPRKKV